MAIVQTIFKRLLAWMRYAWRYWMADIQKRRGCVGKGLSFSIGIMVLWCACAIPISIFDSTGRAVGLLPTLTPTSVPTTTPIPTATYPPTDTPIPTATYPPTDTPIPTATIPPTPTTAPPVGQAVNGGNVRTEPRVTPDTVIGQICPGDGIHFLTQQEVGSDLWYYVRVAVLAADCDPHRVAVGVEGWVSSTLLTPSSYAVHDYVTAIGNVLPTSIPATRTRTPVVIPTSPPIPQPVAPVPIVPSGVRIGAICKDGTRSNATGQGACSRHGGVAQWLLTP